MSAIELPLLETETQLLEINGGMETEAGKGPKGQAVREGEDSPVQETGGGNAAGSCLYKAEPDTARLDKLLPNRQHEGVAERRENIFSRTNQELDTTIGIFT